jgi:hypothetical protein
MGSFQVEYDDDDNDNNKYKDCFLDDADDDDPMTKCTVAVPVDSPIVPAVSRPHPTQQKQEPTGSEQQQANRSCDLRKQVDDIIGQLIAQKSELATAYYEAQQQCSQLIEQESPVSSFLIVTNHNPTLAAHRLLKYWQVRRELFGSVRAYKPLCVIDAEHGGLDENDLLLFSSASYVLLPRKDQCGRSIIAVDRSRQSAEHSTFPCFDQSKIRGLFALITLTCCENPTISASQGVVFLLVSNVAFRRTNYSAVVRYIHEALPVRTILPIFFFLPSRSSMVSTMIEQLIRYMVDSIGVFKDVSIVFRGSSDHEVAQKLMQHLGVTERSLPSWIGGSWTKEDFKRWCRRHQNVQRKMITSANGSIDKLDQLTDCSSDKLKKNSHIRHDNFQKNPDVEVERKRKQALEHSRRQRAKSKQNEFELQQQKIQLEMTNQQIRMNNAQLEQLLQTALKYISTLPPSISNPTHPLLPLTTRTPRHIQQQRSKATSNSVSTASVNHRTDSVYLPGTSTTRPIVHPSNNQQHALSPEPFPMFPKPSISNNTDSIRKAGFMPPSLRSSKYSPSAFMKTNRDIHDLTDQKTASHDPFMESCSSSFSSSTWSQCYNVDADREDDILYKMATALESNSHGMSLSFDNHNKASPSVTQNNNSNNIPFTKLTHNDYHYNQAHEQQHDSMAYSWSNNNNEQPNATNLYKNDALTCSTIDDESIYHSSSNATAIDATGASSGTTAINANATTTNDDPPSASFLAWWTKW